jgi:hypothetical protein
MSEREPWQRRVRRSDGSIDRSAPAPVGPADQPGRDAGRVPEEPRRRRSRDEWRAAASFGPLIGIVVTIVLLLLVPLGIWQMRGASGSDRLLWLIVTIIGLLGAAATGYLLSSISTIRYILGDEELIVRWRHSAHVIPYATIDEVVYDPRQSASGRGWELFWPGFYAYSRRMPPRTLRVVATLDARRRVAILTTGEAVELSPERPVLFLTELDRRRFGVAREPAPETRHEPPAPQTRSSAAPQRAPQRRLPPSADPRFRPRDSQPEQAAGSPRMPGESQPVSEHAQERVERAEPLSERPRFERPEPAGQGRFAVLGWLRDVFRDQLLGDQVSSTLLGVGVIIPVLMVAFLYNQLAGLPDQIPLHWDAIGAVDEVGEPRDLWRLPLLAFVLLIGNTAVATLLIAVDRFLTRLLLAATPIVQILAFIALLRAAL